MSLNFVFLGAGNLATQLSLACKNAGFNILQVFSRTEASAKSLAQKLNTIYTTSVRDINPDADIYIVAIKDSAFDDVLPHVNFEGKLLVHCSGSMPLSVLKKYSENYGVFYPLQTFSVDRNVLFWEIPVFIEANSKKNEATLLKIARKISGSVSVLNSHKRMYLHISAVFACNFVNYFYTVASGILKENDIPFNALKPLIMETAQKVQEMAPENAQTGPAVRFDENIISRHLEALENFPEYQAFYESISKSIFENHKK